MSEDSHELKVGQLIQHPEFGEGVMASSPMNGTVSVLFKKGGEKQVEVSGLSFAHDRLDDLFSSIHPATQEEIDRLDLAVEAESIPLMENKTELTSAKIDLLPHQVVLVHKVSNANPRRFLIADEVGLGKTIETALILRELASRGELKRALIIVPASLVENWRRELNDVFHLDFSVFGKEDNGQPSKDNPFKTYDRLIGSIDTLKREKRVKMLLDSPMWDMIVFDEAHHLTARKNGQNPVITQNYVLAAKIQKHCRDMLLLSATPHQGDNERFLELIKLLNPNLFENVQDMKDNRYRLNSVVIRRTKADACTVDGSPLFARRQVYSKEFYLSKDEYSYYNELLDYLERGYDRDKRKKGKKIGFVMCVFQKIASSSFCALGNAMKNHLVKLLVSKYNTYLETTDGENDNEPEEPKETRYNNAMVPVQDVLDSIKAEAIQVIREVYHLPDGNIGDASAEYEFFRKSRKLKREDEGELESEEFEDEVEFEYDDDRDENDENEDGEEDEEEDDEYEDEQSALQNLIDCLPDSAESKISVLEQALHLIWKESPKEQIIIFATYLGSVEIIERMIKRSFPDKGVVVLKGGDSETKLKVQNQFKQPDGPQVLVCTAAGREGINLQSAKVLFNYDLPWNPMELEQRIGRIHRYGQKETAQVYNLIATNTLEGKIYKRLREKLKSIAETLGKVDKNGQIAEDFEIQILGFLQEELNFRKLYRDALKDRTLKRTEQELDVALKNALAAKEVVSNLFQDLDGFNLAEYQKCSDNGKNMARLVEFIEKQSVFSDYQYQVNSDGLYELKNKRTGDSTLFTKKRKQALDSESLQLFGLEHPIVEQMLQDALSIPVSERALICKSQESGIIVQWKVKLSSNEKNNIYIVKIGLSESGGRNKALEKSSIFIPFDSVTTIPQIPPSFIISAWNALVHEIEDKKLLSSGTVFNAEPLAVFYLRTNES